MALVIAIFAFLFFAMLGTGLLLLAENAKLTSEVIRLRAKLRVLTGEK